MKQHHKLDDKENLVINKHFLINIYDKHLFLQTHYINSLGYTSPHRMSLGKPG